MIRILCYLVAIVTANVITAAFAPLHLGMFIVPMGTFLIGATFIFRDLVQNKFGRKQTYLYIGMALFLSALISLMLHDTLDIVLASALSFLISESTDTEIYSRLKLSMSWRVFYSGLFGGFFDSTIFVIIGLSPIGAHFLTWDAVPYAILGQLVVKTVIQGIGAVILATFKDSFTERFVSEPKL